jgi:hypothetical protein
VTPQQLVISGIRCPRCHRWFCQGHDEADDDDDDEGL